MTRDPYQWIDPFSLHEQFQAALEDQEDRHRIEMRAVSRASYEGAMEIRSRYEGMLRHVTEIAADAETFKRVAPLVVTK